MRNILRFLATTLVAVLIVCALSVATSAATTKFTDVDDNDETLSEAVALLSHLNVTKGTSETTFGTYENVTRQQMAAFIYRLMKQGKTLEGGSNSTKFTDLQDSTYFGYVSWANQTGVINGISETEFYPEGGITLQDAYTMIVRALGYKGEDMIYPFSYIDIAESEEVALDANLSSALDYTNTLTRGDVAILLYNAFFAETGHEETYQRERLIGDDENSKWVLETKSYNPTLAEYVYQVEVGKFVVRATPKYCFNDSYDDDEYVPLYDVFDEDYLQLEAVESGEPLSSFYIPYASLGLHGNADDHVMTTVKVYYTYTTNDGRNSIDKVYFASNQLSTIETTDAKVTYKKAETPEDYLTGTTAADPEGYLTVGTEKIYFFDAPYSYIKPSYTVANTEDDRYWLRNEKDAKFIDIKRLDTEIDTFSYYLDDKVANTPEEFYLSMPRVTARGVYKLKFFDADGDGIYEYVQYMPATFGKMDGDESRVFSDDMVENAPIFANAKGDISQLDLTFVPTIYYNEATITGASFSDGDFVIAYLNPDANIIDVHTVITPYKGFVSYVRRPSGTFRVDSKTFNTAYCYRTVEQLNGGLGPNAVSTNLFGYHSTSNTNYFATLTSAEAIGEEFDIYAYAHEGRNSVLYYKHTGGKRLGYASDKLIIAVRDEDALSDGSYWTESKFDGTLGERVHYTKVWIDGEIKFVTLNPSEMYPKLDFEDGKYNMSLMSLADSSSFAYLDKIATYEVDKYGRYTIKPFLHAYDDDGKYIGVNRDSAVLAEDDNTEQYGNDLDMNYAGRIEKISSTRYRLVDESGETLLGDFIGIADDATTIEYFVLTNNSTILIKNTDTKGTIDTDDDEVEYLEFDMTNFGETDDGVLLTNIQYVLKGDPDSRTRAELLVLYAETNDFEFAEKKAKDGYRFVSSYTPGVDENGEYRNYYTLLNPFTGYIDENVPGNNAVSRPDALEDVYETGSVVELKGGEVDESNEYLGKLDTSDNESGLVWITEYDANDSYIGVVPVAATEDVDCCLDEFNAVIESYTYDGTELNYDGNEFITSTENTDELYYEVTSDTVVTVLSSRKAGDKALTDGTYGLGHISIVADEMKEYKCYNDRYIADDKGNYKKAYAPYFKAYVIAKEAKDEEDMPIAEHIIIVVNAEEPAALLTKSCEQDIH